MDISSVFDFAKSFFALVGIISSFVTIWGYIQQKKFEVPYKEAFEQFKRNVKAEHTSEEIKKLNIELTLLEEQITRDIPRQARLVFLQNQLNELSENIGQLYVRYTNVLNEIKQYTSNQQQLLSDDLQKAIERDIAPDYLKKQRQQNALFRLLYIILLVVFAFNLDKFLAIFPEGPIHIGDPYRQSNLYPLRWVVAFIILCFVVAIILHNLLGWRIIRYVKRHRTHPIRQTVPFMIFIPLSLFSSIIISFSTREWASDCLSSIPDCATPSEWVYRILFLSVALSIIIFPLMPIAYNVPNIMRQIIKAYQQPFKRGAKKP